MNVFTRHAVLTCYNTSYKLAAISARKGENGGVDCDLSDMRQQAQRDKCTDLLHVRFAVAVTLTAPSSLCGWVLLCVPRVLVMLIEPLAALFGSEFDFPIFVSNLFYLQPCLFFYGVFRFVHRLLIYLFRCC